MLKQKNSKKQGDVGVGQAIAYFSSLGYTVLFPLSDSQPYDLVVDDGVLKRVQVKTTTHKRFNVYSVELRTLGGNQSFHTIKKFDLSAVDLIFVFTEDGKRYLIPTNKIKVRTRLNLGEQMKKFQV